MKILADLHFEIDVFAPSVHLIFYISRLRRAEAAKLNREMICPAKSNPSMEGGGGVVGEVDSHYDYRHKIYSLHMSYGLEASAR